MNGEGKKCERKLEYLCRTFSSTHSYAHTRKVTYIHSFRHDDICAFAMADADHLGGTGGAWGRALGGALMRSCLLGYVLPLRR